MAWLFPYGSGGAEQTYRPVPLNINEWVDHCLHFKDDRFRKDPAFIFVCYKVVQVRDRVMKTRVLLRKLCKGSLGRPPPTAANFDYALSVIVKEKTLFNDHTAAVQRIRAYQKDIKIMGATSVDSVFTRDAGRGKMMGLITYYGLPSAFITINPSDISNGVVSFWHNTCDDPFNLDTLFAGIPKLPATCPDGCR